MTRCQDYRYSNRKMLSDFKYLFTIIPFFGIIINKYLKSESVFLSEYTGCIKKKVIELWSALARSLYDL